MVFYIFFTLTIFDEGAILLILGYLLKLFNGLHAHILYWKSVYKITLLHIDFIEEILSVLILRTEKKQIKNDFIPERCKFTLPLQDILYFIVKTWRYFSLKLILSLNYSVFSYLLNLTMD